MHIRSIWRVCTFDISAVNYKRLTQYQSYNYVGGSPSKVVENIEFKKPGARQGFSVFSLLRSTCVFFT